MRTARLTHPAAVIRRHTDYAHFVKRRRPESSAAPSHRHRVPLRQPAKDQPKTERVKDSQPEDDPRVWPVDPFVKGERLNGWDVHAADLRRMVMGRPSQRGQETIESRSRSRAARMY